MEKHEDRRKEVEEILGSPVLADMPDELRKTKRNLLAVASVVIFVSIAEIEVTQAGFLGFQFTNPSEVLLNLSLVCIVTYFALQFGWQVLDYLLQTRVRITGTRVAHITTAGTGTELEGDYPTDPAQSSLYNWWREHAKHLKSLNVMTERLDDLEQRVAVMEVASNEEPKRPGGQLSVLGSEVGKTGNDMRAILKRWDEIFSCPRISMSLKRFDMWFKLFSRSQVWRLFVLDIALPLVFAIVAASCLIFPELPPAIISATGVSGQPQ